MTKWLLYLLSAASLSAQSMDPTDWRSLYNNYTLPVTFVERGSGWEFDFPPYNPDPKLPWWEQFGQVNYVMTDFVPPAEPTAVVMKLRLESSPAVVYYSMDRPDVLPCKVRPMLQSAEAVYFAEKLELPYEFRRWWPINVYYALGSNDNQDITLYAPLEPGNWSSVYGVRGDQTPWFHVAMNRIQSVGFTFGGNFYGHGVRLSEGAATFVLLAYRLIYANDWLGGS